MDRPIWIVTLFNYHKQYLTLVNVIQLVEGCHSLVSVEEVID
jgi:hypothetical protein